MFLYNDHSMLNNASKILFTNFIIKDNEVNTVLFSQSVKLCKTLTTISGNKINDTVVFLESGIYNLSLLNIKNNEMAQFSQVFRLLFPKLPKLYAKSSEIKLTNISVTWQKQFRIKELVLLSGEQFFIPMIDEATMQYSNISLECPVNLKTYSKFHYY